jgi:hypothetical protein
MALYRARHVSLGEPEHVFSNELIKGIAYFVVENRGTDRWPYMAGIFYGNFSFASDEKEDEIETMMECWWDIASMIKS